MPSTPPNLPASSTPLLDKIGRDLTALARQGMLTPIFGREQETQWVIETLLRTEKRNPVLLGPAGVGKTAIVEGLAQRIVAGSVPPLLKNVRLVEVPLGGLVAGTQYRGQLEDRVLQLVSEASRPDIVLFFDEIHLLEGTGQSEGGIGAAELLKPALARGDIAVIGATTADAWRDTIAKDDALARRFSTLAVSELDEDASKPILRSVADGLEKARGVHVTDEAIGVLLDFADKSIVNRRFPDKGIDLLQQAVAQALVDGRKSVDVADARQTTTSWSARVASAPTLERFGRELVSLGKQGALGPIVGRDREMDAMIEILIRHSKRNPLLLGPAGAGKTACVEGLGIRIASGKVPPQLSGVRLFDVSLTSLAAGLSSDPSLIDDFLLEARHPSVIVFFDEIHQLAESTIKPIAEALKPALARGDIACIGATTDEEYQADIEPETALARRFTPVEIARMDAAQVRAVMQAVRDSLSHKSGVGVDDAVLDLLIALADRFMPNRSFPDKGVDVLEQAVAYAVTHGQKTVDEASARAAVSAMVGMPLDPAASLTGLATELRGRGLLESAAVDALVARLGVTLRGLDADRGRPDAVALLCAAAADSATPLAQSIATHLYGADTAVIDIDVGGMTGEEAISSLLGSAPGLVGSDRPLPLQELRRAPWQVVLFRGIERAAPQIRDTIAGALASGTLSDAMGRQIPFGSAVVILAAPNADPGPIPNGQGAAALLALTLGSSLIAACDVIVTQPGSVAQADRGTWIRSQLLDPLVSRFQQQGYAVTYADDLVSWVDHHLAPGQPPDAFTDGTLAPALAAGLGAPGSYRIEVRDDRPVLEPAAATQA